MLPVQPLAIPPLPSLVTPLSLSSRCTSLVLVGCSIVSSLVAQPYLLRRLFVELPPLSPHCRLSLSRFASLPRRCRCRPTQFTATRLPPPSSWRQTQFEPTDPPPPPGHIRVDNVDVINNNFCKPRRPTSPPRRPPPPPLPTHPPEPPRSESPRRPRRNHQPACCGG